MKNRILLLATLFATIATGATAADGAPAGNPCVQCHGSDGIGTEAGIPHLNGQLLPYLESSMEKFKTGARPRRAVKHIPEGMDAAQLTDILKGYSSSKAVRARQTAVDPALAAKGDTIYQNRCADCHPDNGRDADKDAPLMAAQDLEYLISQAGDFAEGRRKFAFKMDEAFRGLSAADLTAVAHFFASQDQVEVKKKRRR